MRIVNEIISFTDSWLMCMFVKEEPTCYALVRRVWQQNELTTEDTILYFCRNIL